MQGDRLLVDDFMRLMTLAPAEMEIVPNAAPHIRRPIWGQTLPIDNVRGRSALPPIATELLHCDKRRSGAMKRRASWNCWPEILVRNS